MPNRRLGQASGRQESAEVILELLDHLRGMAQLDGQPAMADVLDEAYSRCARLRADQRRDAAGDDPLLLQ